MNSIKVDDIINDLDELIYCAKFLHTVKKKDVKTLEKARDKLKRHHFSEVLKSPFLESEGLEDGEI